VSTTINTPATPDKTPSAIEALAAKAGFEVEWQDAHKQIQRVPEETLKVLLERLGLPCDNATQLKQSAATLDAELSGRKLPPLMTAEVDRGISLPMAAVKSGARYRIELESGAVIDGRFTSPKGETALLSPISEPGYHTLVINEQRTTLAVAPPRCYTVDDAWHALRPSPQATPQATPPMWGVAAGLWFAALGRRRCGRLLRARDACVRKRAARQPCNRYQPDARHVQRRAEQIQPVLAFIATVPQHRAHRSGSGAGCRSGASGNQSSRCRR